ncbi:DUF2141 domain-containing protein [Motilimonas pumila]|uniref:DUF2141 domain-containing protein n=1 Tax=Motilimonas pumila TaxID=2303987 RepID=A0A418Y9U4_9GAMM|nr:DUF2141 domain-containing protein [Motilimonas pumila]RJG38280.1 DUF2141 domain-containing protein [Motilimonas pumila]
MPHSNTLLSTAFYGLLGATSMAVCHANSLEVTINNIDTQRPGVIRVYLFTADGFPKRHQQALQQQVFTPSQPVRVSFRQVPEVFAIKAFHDENNSDSLTKNWTGIFPAEGLAFSNGATLRFRPPSFAKAKLEYSQTSGSIQLKMIYP